MKKWKVADEMVTAHIHGGEARFLSVETEGEMVAGGGVALVHEHPNKAGNAAMIAAAPEMAEALRPFAHPDLRVALGGNAEGDASPIFQRNEAVLTLGDFRRAFVALKKAVVAP